MAKISNKMKIKNADGTFEDIQISYIGPNKTTSAGVATEASAFYSYAGGLESTASGEGAFANGNRIIASGRYSQAGGATFDWGKGGAFNDYAFSFGFDTIAGGIASQAFGNGTTASSEYQFAQGKFNIEDTEGKYAHIIGNGAPSKKSNAYTLDWDGNAWFAGGVTVGEDRKILATLEDLKAPNGVAAGIYGGLISTSTGYNIPNITIDESGKITNASNSVLTSIYSDTSSEYSDELGLISRADLKRFAYSKIGGGYQLSETSSFSAYLTDVVVDVFNSEYIPRIESVIVSAYPSLEATSKKWYSVNFNTYTYVDSKTGSFNTVVSFSLPEGLYEANCRNESNEFSAEFNYRILYQKDPNTSFSM